MTRAHYTLQDIGEALPWSSLANFVHHLDAGSELCSEIYPDSAYWAGTMRVPLLLAAILDAINCGRWESVAMNTPRGKAKPAKPKPVKRPGIDSGERKYGSGAIPISQWWAWWESGIDIENDGGEEPVEE